MTKDMKGKAPREDKRLLYKKAKEIPIGKSLLLGEKIEKGNRRNTW